MFLYIYIYIYIYIYKYIYIYIYIYYNRFISLVGRVFTNGPGASVQSQVASYQRL